MKAWKDMMKKENLVVLLILGLLLLVLALPTENSITIIGRPRIIRKNR